MTDDAMSHEEAALLLPWLVNGTLDSSERERVERHVRGCVTCRTELVEQRALASLVRDRPVVPLSAERDFERLRRTLDGSPSRGMRGLRTAAWAVAASIAVVAIAASVAPLVVGTREPVEPYRTLTRDEAAPMLVDVVFVDISDDELRDLIETLGAEIVAGPSPRVGRYTLRLVDDRATDADLDDLVRRLRDDRRVRFAARAYSLPTHDGADD